MKATGAGQRFDRVLERVVRHGERVVVGEVGVPVEAIVSIEDLRHLDRRDAERAERFKILDQIGAAFEGVSEEEIERETAKALAEVRAEMRAEREQAAGVRPCPRRSVIPTRSSRDSPGSAARRVHQKSSDPRHRR